MGSYAAVFLLIKVILPKVEVIHIYRSDGLTTHYKNKTNFQFQFLPNFQLFNHFCDKLNLKRASWNISTPEHEKSSADAIGGTVKRLCDEYVFHTLSKKRVLKIKLSTRRIKKFCTIHVQERDSRLVCLSTIASFGYKRHTRRKSTFPH